MCLWISDSGDLAPPLKSVSRYYYLLHNSPQGSQLFVRWRLVRITGLVSSSLRHHLSRLFPSFRVPRQTRISFPALHLVPWDRFSIQYKALPLAALCRNSSPFSFNFAACGRSTCLRTSSDYSIAKYCCYLRVVSVLGIRFDLLILFCLRLLSLCAFQISCHRCTNPCAETRARVGKFRASVLWRTLPPRCSCHSSCRPRQC